MNTIVTINEENPPTIWSEIVEFDKIMRTSEGRKWFNVHRNAKELMFNVVQDLTSTVAGFVAIARRPGYHEALSTGTISPDIFTFPQLQGKQLRLNLQSTILTMLAGPYKEASFIFKSFQPPEPPKKRPAQADVPGESPTTKTRTGTGTGTATNNRIPRTPTTGTPNPSSLIDNIPGQPTPQGKTILKQIAGDPTTKLLHPGPIFPHPTRPNKFTLPVPQRLRRQTMHLSNVQFLSFPTQPHERCERRNQKQNGFLGPIPSFSRMDNRSSHLGKPNR
ncbi:hypothetical protein MHU86_19747 [Fragilaria crotonensis]|nr:hypothetical protein MHU86_19747 [Fragilaria crotonensis]